MIIYLSYAVTGAFLARKIITKRVGRRRRRARQEPVISEASRAIDQSALHRLQRPGRRWLTNPSTVSSATDALLFLLYCALVHLARNHLCAETVGRMIVHQSNGLHKGVANCGTHKLEAALF